MIIDANINRGFTDIRDFEIRNLPIKMASSYDYRIPTELRQFESIISRAVSFEHEINNRVNDFYCYLSVRQGKIGKCKDDIRPKCKAIGFPRPEHNEKTLIGRSYVVYDCLPDVFYPQEIRTDYLDLATDSFFASFDDQIDERCATIYDPYQLLCIDPYMIHREQKVYEDTYRTYVSITYDKEVYNDFGNTKNPMFHYEWNMRYGDLSKRLIHKQLPQA